MIEPESTLAAINPNTLPAWITTLVYICGVVVYRVNKAIEWCNAQDIVAKQTKAKRLTYRAGFAMYWTEHRFIVVRDFIYQLSVGIAWAAGFLTTIIEATGIKLPDKPTGVVWYPLVFTVAFVLSSFLSGRLRNQMLRQIDAVAPEPEPTAGGE